MAKDIELSFTNTTLGALAIIVGIIILIFPHIVEIVLGIFLIVVGILTLTRWRDKTHKQNRSR